jgi:hypothetical protein
MRDKIQDEIADLSELQSWYAGKLASVHRCINSLRKELVDASPEQRLVTDHALIRYMERHKNIDVNALRDELRILASEAVPAKDGEHFWHESGVMLILGDVGQVITVLSPEQAAKHTGRKLKNGKRIEGAEP